MNYKPQVFVQGAWAGNSLVFATREEAQSNADHLMSRWMLVEKTRVIESAEPVNYHWNADTCALTRLPAVVEPL